MKSTVNSLRSLGSRDSVSNADAIKLKDQLVYLLQNIFLDNPEINAGVIFSKLFSNKTKKQLESKSDQDYIDMLIDLEYEIIKDDSNDAEFTLLDKISGKSELDDLFDEYNLEDDGTDYLLD